MSAVVEANPATVSGVTRLVPLVLAVIAAAFLIVSVLSAFLDVRVPRIGDSASYRCSPIGSAIGLDDTGDCTSHVRPRLAVATISGVSGGLFALLAFGLEVGFNRSAKAGRASDDPFKARTPRT